jgi:DNA-directed RNA polymerase subunit M/transcription elongation factor TFIIS
MYKASMFVNQTQPSIMSSSTVSTAEVDIRGIAKGWMIDSMTRAEADDQGTPLTDAERDAMAIDLEKGIYNWAIDFSIQKGLVRNWANPRFYNMYVAKCMSVAANLQMDSYIGNVRLISRLREREFMPRDLPFMRPENVFPEVWKSVLDVKLMRDQFFEKPEAMTDQFRCGRCKKRECVYQELQLRSSDEPMSLFITCLNCGNRWRMG